MVQNIVAMISTEDYELKGDSDGRVMMINHPKHMKILGLKLLFSEMGNGVKSELTSTAVEIGETKCSIELPPVSAHTMISVEISCLCAQPVTLDLGYRYHRRTHSAPPTTVHKYVQSEYSKTNHLDVDIMPRVQNSSEFKLSRSPFGRRTGDSPVKKFLSFVREVADRVDTRGSPKSEKGEEFRISETNDFVDKDEFLEVILDETDTTRAVETHHDGGDKEKISLGSSSGMPTDDISLNDTISVNSVSPVKDSAKTTGKNGVSRSNLHQRHTLAIHEECQLEDNSKVMCNISFTLPWDDLPPISTSTNFMKLLEFSHKALRSYSSSKVPDYSCVQTMVSVQVENCSQNTFFLKNYFLKPTSQGVTAAGLLTNEVKKICPSQKVKFAWKVRFSSKSPPDCNAHFHADVSSSASESSMTTEVSYKFEIENIQPLYTVSTQIGADGEELIGGQMTTLNITVKRIRRDPEHEHTRGGQQLLMYHVIDTRGRWAVCGKSTGVMSIPLSSIEAANLGPPVAKASLEIMPLVDGLLHRPVVVLQRYLKRRSGEFDEQLSSTESPVLKPPKLLDFRRNEIINIDEYMQVKVVDASAKKSSANNETSGDSQVLQKNKL